MEYADCLLGFHHHHEADQAPHETPDQYAARLRMQRERQEQAANRRAEEEATRKANQERERERGKLSHQNYRKQ